MTENLLIQQDYTPPTVEPCPKCGAGYWTHTDMGQGYDRISCHECDAAIWGFSGLLTPEPSLATWNALSKERQRLQSELSTTKDKLSESEALLAKAVDVLEGLVELHSLSTNEINPRTVLDDAHTTLAELIGYTND